MGTPRLNEANPGGAIGEIARWVTDAGLSGLAESALLQGFCERLGGAGVPLARVTLGIDTLHPVLEGRVFTWRRDEGCTRSTEYSREQIRNNPERWLQSPFNHLLQNGGTMLRRTLSRDRNFDDFPMVEEYRRDGMTDYVAMVHRFGESGSIGEMDCTFSSFVSDAGGGFSDADMAMLVNLAPALSLALKCVSVKRIAETLVETYLGRDAGRRVLSGRILRGVADRIEAALWFSDLRDFTRLADVAPSEDLIPFLNDYADALVTAVHDAGGDVLKFIGDGILAIFTHPDAETRCRCALAAADDARARVVQLNGKRDAAGLPITQFYLGLHVGEVFYGNIGSVERLDFTVVGSAVNEVSRIAALCRSLDQPTLLSSAFAVAAGGERRRLISVGRYALRGVRRPQELYTLDPEMG